MTDQSPEGSIRAWAKAYRETPEYRFPSDPHAEFFPVDLELAADEIDRLRKQLEIAMTALRRINSLAEKNVLKFAQQIAGEGVTRAVSTPQGGE